ncbi:MAG: LysM peptidoglycan-binding domain-containing protein [Desulfovibrionales bacterium]
MHLPEEEPIPSLPQDEPLPKEAEIVEPDEEEALDADTGPESLSPQEETALETQPAIHFDLDGLEIKEMEHYFLYFTRRNKTTFQKWLKRSEPFLPYIQAHFAARGLPPDLVYLPFAESGYNPWAYSRAGAAGLWQFMPYTGRKFDLQVDWWIDERRDPYLATEAAASYLELLYEKFDDWYLALAAYNAGEGRIARALAKSGCDNIFDLAKNRGLLPLETRHYVPKFLAILKIIRNLETLGFETLQSNGAPAPEMIEVKPGTDLLALADACSINWKDFRHMNPAFRRMVSPPDQTARVYLPTEKVEVAKAHLEDESSRKYAGYTRHRIASGESWWRISRRYDVPVSILKKLNNRRSNILRPGEWVLVPGHSRQTASASLSKKRMIAMQRSNYVVQKGDTLWDISRATDIPVKTILEANGMQNARNLRTGQKLYIPHSSEKPTRVAKTEPPVSARLVEYRVKRGDTLWDIARMFGVKYQDLQAWNEIDGKNYIQPGDNLKVYVQ